MTGQPCCVLKPLMRAVCGFANSDLPAPDIHTLFRRRIGLSLYSGERIHKLDDEIQSDVHCVMLQQTG